VQLQAAFSRSPAVSELQNEAARRLVLLLGLRLAARAVRGIEDDEDDLFYDTGRTTQALMQALVRGCGLGVGVRSGFGLQDKLHLFVVLCAGCKRVGCYYDTGRTKQTQADAAAAAGAAAGCAGCEGHRG
jgi:hypothetical protein